MHGGRSYPTQSRRGFLPPGGMGATPRAPGQWRRGVHSPETAPPLANPIPEIALENQNSRAVGGAGKACPDLGAAFQRRHPTRDHVSTGRGR